MSATPLQALSALILWVQTASESGSAQTFRKDALARLERQIPFDRAIWADASIAASLSLRSAELYNIGQDIRGDFEQAASADPRLPQVLSAAGNAHAYSVRPDDPDLYRALTAKIGVAHFISIAHFDQALGVASGLVLFGAPKRAPFRGADRGFVEAVFPHLMSAWTHCQVTELERNARCNRALPLFSAACQGVMINAAEPEFLSLLQREWPGWVGPHLPGPLIDPDTGSARALHVGDRIVVHSKVAVDTALVIARERSVVDDLTARERSVAQLCAQGFTYKGISARLRLAPATARNHIAAVHRRLGVTRNSEISGLLAMTAPPWPAE